MSDELKRTQDMLTGAIMTMAIIADTLCEDYPAPRSVLRTRLSELLDTLPAGPQRTACEETLRILRAGPLELPQS